MADQHADQLIERSPSVSRGSASLRMPDNDQRADQVKGEVKKLGGIGVGHPYFD